MMLSDESAQGERQGGSHRKAQGQEERHQGTCGLSIFRLHQPGGNRWTLVRTQTLVPTVGSAGTHCGAYDMDRQTK